jgi:predicted phage terminase large subunit-like protein
MGSWAFNGQYQQRPAPLEGGLIKRSWVRFYRHLPEHFDFIVQSWDCTFSGGSDNDFVAGQVWARSGGKYYMLPYRTYDRLDFGPTMAAIKSCHAKFPRAHAILVEDKANGPAIISELRKEIPGIIAVNPEGGKISRAQATAPLWEAGSIELPDPQLFNCPWIEDYLHNICTFPKAAHDDDMDSTSQALIYMRSRLGGGIMDFYRQQATGEIAPKRTAKLSQLELDNALGAQAPGSPERAGFARHGVEVPSPAIEPVSDSTLARNVIAAVLQGSQIHCNARQYPEIRAALVYAARHTAVITSNMNHSGDSQDQLSLNMNHPCDSQDQLPSAQLSAVIAEKELHRLDLLFGYQE